MPSPLLTILATPPQEGEQVPAGALLNTDDAPVLNTDEGYLLTTTE